MGLPINLYNILKEKYNSDFGMEREYENLSRSKINIYNNMDNNDDKINSNNISKNCNIQKKKYY